MTRAEQRMVQRDLNQQMIGYNRDARDGTPRGVAMPMLKDPKPVSPEEKLKTLTRVKGCIDKFDMPQCVKDFTKARIDHQASKPPHNERYTYPNYLPGMTTLVPMRPQETQKMKDWLAKAPKENDCVRSFQNEQRDLDNERRKYIRENNPNIRRDIVGSMVGIPNHYANAAGIPRGMNVGDTPNPTLAQAIANGNIQVPMIQNRPAEVLAPRPMPTLKSVEQFKTMLGVFDGAPPITVSECLENCADDRVETLRKQLAALDIRVKEAEAKGGNPQEIQAMKIGFQNAKNLLKATEELFNTQCNRYVVKPQPAQTDMKKYLPWIIGGIALYLLAK